MKKRANGILMALFAFAAIAFVAGCSGSGASSEDDVKQDMEKIDQGLQGVEQLPPEALEGPIPKGPKGGGGGAAAGG